VAGAGEEVDEARVVLEGRGEGHGVEEQKGLVDEPGVAACGERDQERDEVWRHAAGLHPAQQSQSVGG
jgi:hypothetical protein